MIRVRTIEEIGQERILLSVETPSHQIRPGDRLYSNSEVVRAEAEAVTVSIGQRDEAVDKLHDENSAYVKARNEVERLRRICHLKNQEVNDLNKELLALRAQNNRLARKAILYDKAEVKVKDLEAKLSTELDRADANRDWAERAEKNLNESFKKTSKVREILTSPAVTQIRQEALSHHEVRLSEEIGEVLKTLDD